MRHQPTNQMEPPAHRCQQRELDESRPHGRRDVPDDLSDVAQPDPRPPRRGPKASDQLLERLDTEALERRNASLVSGNQGWDPILAVIPRRRLLALRERIDGSGGKGVTNRWTRHLFTGRAGLRCSEYSSPAGGVATVVIAVVARDSFVEPRREPVGCPHCR